MPKTKTSKNHEQITWDNLESHRHLFEEEDTTDEERKRWEKARQECLAGETISFDEIIKLKKRQKY